MLKKRVTTIVTPGETIDMLVTDYGIAVNPRRADLLDELQGKGLPLLTIDELKAKADALTGKATELNLSDDICGVVEYRDGSIIDVIRKL